MQLAIRNGTYEVMPANTERYFEFKTKLEAKTKMVELGADPVEVDIAFEQLEENNHTTAHIGDVNGTFMFTER